MGCGKGGLGARVPAMLSGRSSGMLVRQPQKTARCPVHLTATPGAGVTWGVGQGWSGAACAPAARRSTLSYWALETVTWAVLLV